MTVAITRRLSAPSAGGIFLLIGVMLLSSGPIIFYADGVTTTTTSGK